MTEPAQSADCDAPPGTVVRYTPDRSRHDPSWCREGMAIADDRGVLLDTYWGSGSDNHRLLPVELATVENLFNLGDYEELDRYSHASKDKWLRYHPDDREVVTSQHRLQVRWFIRKGASPDFATQVENAEDEVREAQEKAESAQRQLDWKRRQLAELKTSVIPPEVGK